MSERPELCVLAGSVGDAERLRVAGAERVYLDVIDLEPTDEVLGIVERERLVPVLDEVCREPDHARLDPWVRSGLPVAVGNLSELSLARERDALAETRGCIPVHNASTLRVIEHLGVRCAWLSPELSLAEACDLACASVLPLGVTVYGRPRLMTCEHCALQVAYECDRDHAHCPHRRESQWLVNIDDRHLPVRTDARGRSRVYLDEPVDLIPRAAELVGAGVGRLLVDATTTSAAEACEALERLRRVLAGEAVSACGLSGLSETGVE